MWCEVWCGVGFVFGSVCVWRGVGFGFWFGFCLVWFDVF